MNASVGVIDTPRADLDRAVLLCFELSARAGSNSHLDVVPGAALAFDLDLTDLWGYIDAGIELWPAFARCASAPPLMWHRWLTSDSHTVAAFAASNPAADPDLLAAASRDWVGEIYVDYERQSAVVTNPQLPSSELRRIVNVRAGLWVDELVAANPSTPPSALAKLAERAAVTESAECLFDALAANPATPARTLDTIARGTPGAWALRNVASNPSTSTTTLDHLEATAPSMVIHAVRLERERRAALV